MAQQAPGGGGSTAWNPSLTHGPRRIFLGWTALVFAAGGGYFIIKSINNEKKKKYFASQTNLKEIK